MPYPRVQADGAALVAAVLTAAQPQVTVRTLLEADLMDNLPYWWVSVRESERDPRGSAVARVTVESWSGVSYADVRDLDEAARVALHEAWKAQVPNAHGHISTYRKDGASLDLPSGKTAVWRRSSTYELGIRPPRSAP